MPSFSNPWSNIDPDKEMSRDEIVSALRFAIAAELEAISIYEQISRKVKIAFVKDNMKSLAEEEMVHVGELLMLIANLDQDEFSKYKEGMTEADEIIKKINRGKQ